MLSCTDGSVDECGLAASAAALEVNSDGDSSSHGISGPRRLQPGQHETVEAALGPPALQGVGAPISAGTGVT